MVDPVKANIFFLNAKNKQLFMFLGRFFLDVIVQNHAVWMMQCQFYF